MGGGFRAQIDQAFANLRRALEADRSSLKDVVKVTILVTDMGNFGEVVEARRQHFSPPCPADSLVEVRALYTRGALVEIKAVALRSAAREG